MFPIDEIEQQALPLKQVTRKVVGVEKAHKFYKDGWYVTLDNGRDLIENGKTPPANVGDTRTYNAGNFTLQVINVQNTIDDWWKIKMSNGRSFLFKNKTPPAQIEQSIGFEVYCADGYYEVEPLIYHLTRNGA